MVSRAFGVLCVALLASCHLILGYEGPYEEGSSSETAQNGSTGPCACEAGEQQPCGNCGVRTCDDACAFGACEAEGVCVPGTEEECGGGCGVRVCSNACTWCGCPTDSCAACEGMGGWPGCRGNGCSVCIEKIEAHPCYLQNHPDCAANVACKDEYFGCNAKCPPPTVADACACPPVGGGFWSGCFGSGCEVCGDVVAEYACYFVHHPLCVGQEICEDKSLCNSDLCPPPTDADKGAMR